MLDLLRRLDAADGPSGGEQPVLDLVDELLDGAFDERAVDPLGSTTFTRRGPAGTPSLLLAAHVDQLGGGAVLVELVRRLAGEPLPVTLHAAFTVQEEVGLRGAGPVGAALQPDVALSVDVGLCGDTPGTSFARSPLRLRQGPAIT